MKGKNKTKLSQLEKQFSDLAKDVAELRQTLAKDVEVDVEEVKSELIVGEWYKNEKYGYIFCFNGKYEDFSQYGINIEGKWKNNLSSNKNHLPFIIKATPQEVQTALENEAKKRGFKEGVYFTDRNKETYLISKDLSKGYSFDNNKLYLYGWEIFYDGIWAKIQQETIKEEEIDWSVPQLLISIHTELVVYSNGIHKTYDFEAYIIVLDKYHKYHKTLTSWSKNCFKPFKGELTIK